MELLLPSGRHLPVVRRDARMLFRLLLSMLAFLENIFLVRAATGDGSGASGTSLKTFEQDLMHRMKKLNYNHFTAMSFRISILI